jgi:hypothetical protein
VNQKAAEEGWSPSAVIQTLDDNRMILPTVKYLNPLFRNLSALSLMIYGMLGNIDCRGADYISPLSLSSSHFWPHSFNDKILVTHSWFIFLIKFHEGVQVCSEPEIFMFFLFRGFLRFSPLFRRCMVFLFTALLNNSKRQEVLGRTNRLLSLIRHGQYRKRHVQ